MTAAAVSAATLDDGTRQLSRDVFKELIEINTTDSTGHRLRPLQQVAAEMWPGMKAVTT